MRPQRAHLGAFNSCVVVAFLFFAALCCLLCLPRAILFFPNVELETAMSFICMLQHALQL